MQPLFCLSEVSGGTRHPNLRQCSGSASSKLPLLHSSPALVSDHQALHGTLTDHSHMPTLFKNGRQPLNFVSAGTPKLSKDPIGLLLVISEVHKRIDHGEGRRKKFLVAESHLHCIYLDGQTNRAIKFHLQAMHLQDPCQA